MCDERSLNFVLLRSFLAVSETLRFTTAARRFGSDSLVALIAAVGFGVGIIAQASQLGGRNLELAAADAVLPQLPEVAFVVLGRSAHLEGPADALAKAITIEPDLRSPGEPMAGT